MIKIITANAPEGKSARKPRQTKGQAKAAAAQKEARAAEVERRLDTRRKVVIGAALMSLAERDPDAADMLAKLTSGLTRAVDRKLFAEDPQNG